jgi:hypothetical protein
MIKKYPRQGEPKSSSQNWVGKGGFAMARIKIEDLPKEMKISKEELKKVMGGRDYSQTSVLPYGVDLKKGSLIEYMGIFKPGIVELYG